MKKAPAADISAARGLYNFTLACVVKRILVKSFVVNAGRLVTGFCGRGVFWVFGMAEGFSLR